MAQSVTLKQFAQNGVYRGINSVMPDSMKFPPGFTLASHGDMRILCPKIDASTPAVNHYRYAYPGMRWECAVRAILGVLPYQYGIEGDEGMTIGQGLSIDENGDYYPNENAGNAIIESPQAGHRYQSVVTVFGQDSQAVNVFDVLCATGFHFFTAPTARGTGSGDSPENAKAWADTYLGATTNSPAKGKILVCMGGDYTGAELDVNPTYTPTNIIAYSGETANFKFKIKISTNDYFIGNGIVVADLEISQGGAVNVDGKRDRGVFHKLHAKNLLQSGPSNQNQSFIFFNNLNSQHRENIVITGCKMENCTTHLTETYSLGSAVIDRNEIIFNNGATDAPRIGIFVKINNKLVQVTHNTFDNPGMTCTFISFGGQGNAATGQCIGIAQYNYCRSNGGIGIATNREAGNGEPASSICYIERNSFVNSQMDFYKYGEAIAGTHTYSNNNAVQNIHGGANNSSSSAYGNYTETGKELYGISGIFDSNGRVPNGPLRGQRSKQIWKPS